MKRLGAAPCLSAMTERTVAETKRLADELTHQNDTVQRILTGILKRAA